MTEVSKPKNLQHLVKLISGRNITIKCEGTKMICPSCGYEHNIKRCPRCGYCEDCEL